MTRSDPLLKTRQVAEALGVSVSTIKRWVDGGTLRASRTVGKHRLIRLSEALRLARLQGLPQAGLEGFVTAAESSIAAIDERLCVALSEALSGGDVRGSKALIAAAHALGFGAAVLADRLIRPVMERLGQQWAAGAIDIYREHEASHIVASALIELNEQAMRSHPATASVPIALGATPEGDPYLLPLLLGELTLREAGWDVRNLGVNLPLRSFAEAIGESRPALAFLSLNHLVDPDRWANQYPVVARAAAAAGTAVVLGGRALGPELRGQLKDAKIGNSMADLAGFAWRLLADAPVASEPDPTGIVEPRETDELKGSIP